jgi:Putative auto-transporter adhesin, head GIN domain
MKILKFCIALLTLSVVTFTSCVPDITTGSGSIVTETRSVNTSFKEIRVEGPMNCFVKQGDSVKIVAKDFANLLPMLETKVIGSTLVIKYTDNTWVKNSAGEVTVTLPQVTLLEMTGSGDMGTIGSFRFNDLSLLISGSGDFSLAGSAKKVNAKISGSGDIRAFDMPCDTATIRITGSGNVETAVNKNLDATITGSGNITYKGSPAVSTSVTGSGRIRKF